MKICETLEAPIPYSIWASFNP